MVCVLIALMLVKHQIPPVRKPQLRRDDTSAAVTG
jgi:hypothetical protein